MLTLRHNPGEFRDAFDRRDASRGLRPYHRSYRAADYQHVPAIARELERLESVRAPVLLYRLEHGETGAGPFGWSPEVVRALGPAYKGPVPFEGPSGGVDMSERCACADWESWCRWFRTSDLRVLERCGFVAAAYLAEAGACTVPDRWGQVIFRTSRAVTVERYKLRAFARGKAVVIPEPPPPPPKPLHPAIVWGDSVEIKIDGVEIESWSMVGFNV
jgi:hypothetical protein